MEPAIPYLGGEEGKLAGYLGAVVCYGHNVLIRVEPVLQVGGFDERYVSEDFATAVTLASRGHGSAFVPLHSWEAMPDNVRGFVKRQNKWTRGSMDLHRPQRKRIPDRHLVEQLQPFQLGPREQVHQWRNNVEQSQNAHQGKLVPLLQ